MTTPIRKSLALRLTALYTVLFALSLAAVFGVLYHVLASALEEREQAAVERLAGQYFDVYAKGGPLALRQALGDERVSPDGRALFLRILQPDGTPIFAMVPSGWVETQVERIAPPNGWGEWQPKVTQTVRIPRDADKDFTVTSRQLQDGRLLQVGRSSDNRTTLLAPLRRAAQGVVPAALLLSAAAGAFAAWRVTHPIRLAKDTTQRILETGDLEARVPSPGGSGELAELVQQLNTVLGRNAALIRAQRETLDNLAHDIRTPLARLRGAAELALQDHADAARANEALADCVEESERVLRLLEAMLDVSAAETGTMHLRKERCDLRSLGARAVDLYREVADDKGITLVLDAGNDVPVEVDTARLGQAVANLVDNAVKYTPTGGRVSLHIRRDGAKGVLEVNDSGPGIALEEHEKIWGRLYRSDRSRSQRGLGLGLSLVKAIVEAHGGSVQVGAAEGGGARFSVLLDVAD